MAMAYKIKDNNRIVCISTDFQHFDVNKFMVFIKIGNSMYGMQAIGSFGNNIIVDNTLYKFDSVINFSKNTDNIFIEIAIKDILTNSIVHIENLLFHQNVFVNVVDYAKKLTLPGFICYDNYEKPNIMAAFTHVYNDNCMLFIWRNYFASIVGYENLYVIDHGSSISPKDILHPDVNVVKIPRDKVDHRNIAQFCNYFQRFLLTQYRWVIHTDADELVIHRHGFSSFVDQLREDYSETIFKPRHGYAILQDIKKETALELDRPISLQRRFMFLQKSYDKPVLTSTPATWTTGFHAALEYPLQTELDDLYLIHLSFVDAKLFLDKNIKWKQQPLTGYDRNYTPHESRRDCMKDINKEFSELYKKESVVTLPDWMIGMF